MWYLLNLATENEVASVNISISQIHLFMNYETIYFAASHIFDKERQKGNSKMFYLMQKKEHLRRHMKLRFPGLLSAAADQILRLSKALVIN